jgi:hypothetical protein
MEKSFQWLSFLALESFFVLQKWMFLIQASHGNAQVGVGTLYIYIVCMSNKSHLLSLQSEKPCRLRS